MSDMYLLHKIKQLSLVNLYRLQVLIEITLSDPVRLSVIKNRLYVGMDVYYYYHKENNYLRAKVVELRNRKVVIWDVEQRTKFVIPYCMIDLEKTDAKLNIPEATAENLHLGDVVCFCQKNEKMFGIVRHLNKKTVTIAVAPNEKRRIAYEQLNLVNDKKLANRLSYHIKKGDDINNAFEFNLEVVG